jgi:hypothetical protein
MDITALLLTKRIPKVQPGSAQAVTDGAQARAARG